MSSNNFDFTFKSCQECLYYCQIDDSHYVCNQNSSTAINPPKIKDSQKNAQNCNFYENQDEDD